MVQQQKNLNSLRLYFTKILQGKWTQPILPWLLTTRTLTKISEQDISLVEKAEPLKWLVPIFCDVFRSERLLLSYVDLKVILNRNVNEFCLMASEADVDYRVKLTEAYLKIRKVKVSPSISIAHELALKKGPAIYPIRRVECKTFIISAGNPSLRKDNVFNGLVPKTFAMVMVDSAAFNGDHKKNPFNFKTFTTSFLGIAVNGEEVPFRPLTAFLHGSES